MAMNRSSAVPRVPTLPEGVEIASFATYLEAQRAVDHLSDSEFAVQHVTIVGTDLRMVERITGRLSVPRVAFAGLMTGAWFGIFVGLIFGLMSEGGLFAVLVPSVLIGGIFGVVFGLVSYAFSRGNRDFTSSSQVVAGRYALLCEVSHAYNARQLLRQARLGGAVPPNQPLAGVFEGDGQTRPGDPPAAPGRFGEAAAGPPPAPYGAPVAPSAEEPSGPGPSGGAPEASQGSSFRPLEDEHGNPRYGRRLPGPSDGQEDRPQQSGSEEQR